MDSKQAMLNIVKYTGGTILTVGISIFYTDFLLVTTAQSRVSESVQLWGLFSSSLWGYSLLQQKKCKKKGIKEYVSFNKKECQLALLFIEFITYPKLKSIVYRRW